MNISVDELLQVLGNPQGGHPDLAAAVAKLGITEAQLKALLLPPPGQ